MSVGRDSFAPHIMFELALSSAAITCTYIPMGVFAGGSILGVLWQPPHTAWHSTPMSSLAPNFRREDQSLAITESASRHHAAVTRLRAAVLGQPCSPGRGEN